MSDLRVGVIGPGVLDWQRALNVEVAEGRLPDVSPLAEDARFDTITEAATKAFQRAHGLPVSGVVDSLTRGFLKFLKDDPNGE